MILKTNGAILFILAALLVFGLSNQAGAAPMSDPCIGGDCTVSGPFSGNDNEAGLTTILGVPVMEIFKADFPPTSGNGVSVTSDPADNMSGTWASQNKAIDYVAVKAGPNFLIQNYVDAGGAALSGLWSTAGLTVGQNNNQPDISHVTFYMQNPIPIPAAAWLFGTGLVGLIGIARRKGLLTNK